jgi:hypothetical protein
MPDPNRLAETTVLRLVDALNDMRNAMVKASLLLQDVHFESDANQRRAAVEHLDKLMEKIKSQ